MQQIKNLLKCWEYYKCSKKECSAYQSSDLRCWLQCGTHCHNEIQETWLEKMEACIKCKVFITNFQEKDSIETLSLIGIQFKEYKQKVLERTEQLEETNKRMTEFKLTSVYMLKELDKKSEELMLSKNYIEEAKSDLEKKVDERTHEIRSMQTQLIQSAKMASIGQFSAGIAHEINNPLGAIINYVRATLANPEIKGQNKGYIELTLKGLFRIENIVKQILNYSGHQKCELGSVNINQVIKDTIPFVQHKLLDQKIELVLNLNNTLPDILADSHQLQQVFINIINNAIDALHIDGILKIETDSNGKETEIKFIDNGKGIKEEKLDKIFDPFYTDKEVGKGTGLGLFVSYNIIQIHGGTIKIKSEEGKGTTVTIAFPIKTDD
ncbi:MAG: ATP-binding protein [Elusimicrobia bacterium]|nr:ATP-binding protein [Elusimicrobiota bacterium]